MSNVVISDWIDATRPMRGALNEALARLRESIEPPPRITEPSLMSPELLEQEDTDELHTQIERALDAVLLDEVREVGTA